MSKNVIRVMSALFVLSSLFLTSGHNRLSATQDQSISAPNQEIATVVVVPQISKYGGLVGLKDGAGRDLLKEIKHRWYEGYAIAYQVKDSKGVYEDQFVYVMGDQASPRNLKVDRQKSTNSRKIASTQDNALEIGRSIIWDKESRALKSNITITNTSNREVTLRAIEIDIDKSVATRLALPAYARPPYDIPRPQCPDPPLYAFSIPASMDCLAGDDCNPCPCVRPPDCHPGQARVFERNPMDPGPVIIGDVIGPGIRLFEKPMVCLSWAGSSLTRSVLKPGEQTVVQYRIDLPRPRE